MKIHMRLDESNAVHTRLTVFLSGANCGQLTMQTETEVVHFLMIFRHGLSDALDDYRETGKLYDARTERAPVVEYSGSPMEAEG